jgi:predicted DNA-binding protein (MmcQ/YjbR family)
MMSLVEFKKLALSFPNTVDAPHFDRIAFKVEKKRIFATLHEDSATVNMKLSVTDQSAFCAFGKKGVYPVPNKWGLQGWTTFELKKAPKALVADALDTAYKDVFNTVPKKK